MPLKLRAPFVIVPEYPEQEQRPIEHLLMNVGRAVDIVNRFEYALDLFAEARERRQQAKEQIYAMRAAESRESRGDLEVLADKMKGWIEMAARHGAMLAYSCAELRQKDASLFPHCPSISHMVDKAALKESRMIFEKAFPSIAKVRLSAAHPFEHGSSPADYDKHAVKGTVYPGRNEEGLGMSLVDSGIAVCGNELKYSSTVNRQLVEYTLSAETLSMFSDSVSIYVGAFASLDSSL